MATPRAGQGIVKRERPGSAVYIGSGSQPGSYGSLAVATPPGIPDLPEPPSPGVESTGSSFSGSGLPSPPATNSTGSGSTGDPGSIAFRSSVGKRAQLGLGLGLNGEGRLFRQALGAGVRSASSGNASAAMNGAAAHPNIMDGTAEEDGFDDLDDDLDDDGDGEDNTARMALNLDRRQSLELNNSTAADFAADDPSASDNVAALQRVRSLTQRNRMALDKLSSISRLSPSPGGPSKSNSPAPPPTFRSPSGGASNNSGSSSSSSRKTSSSLARADSLSSSSTRHTASSLARITRNLSSSSTSGSRTSDLPSSLSPSASASQTNAEKRLSNSSSDTERESVHSSYSSAARRPTSSPRNPRDTLTRQSTTATITTSTRNRSGTVTPPTTTRSRLVSAPASPGKALNAVRNSPVRGGDRDTARRNRLSVTSYDDLQDDEHQIVEEDRDEAGRRSVMSSLSSRYRDRDRRESSESPTANILSAAQGKRRNPLPKEFFEPGAAGANGSGGGGSVRRRGSIGQGSTISWADENGRNSVDPHTPYRSISTSQRSPKTSPSNRDSRRSSMMRLSQDYSAFRYEEEPTESGYRREGDEGRRQSLRGGSAESALFAARSLGIGVRRNNGAPEDVFAEGSTARRERAGTVTNEHRAPSKSRERVGGGRVTSMADYSYTHNEREREREGVREHRTGPASLRVNGSGHGRESSLSRDRSPNKDERPPTSLSRYQHAADRERDRASPYSSRRFTAPVPTSTSHGQNLSAAAGSSEHTRLLVEALSMFEAHLARVGVGGTGLGRDAQSVVLAADRLNALLRLGTTAALEEQIDAEVAAQRDDRRGDEAERDVVMWKRVGGDYREALRVSDDLVRSMTGFLLDVGRVVKDLGDGAGFDGAAQRSSLSPEVGGRRSAESRRSWEKSPQPPHSGGRDRERERDDALRRLQGGAGSRPSSSVALRERERLQQSPPPPLPKTTERTTPRNSIVGSGGDGIKRYTLRDSSSATRERGTPNHEPSPTPASRGTAANAKSTTATKSNLVERSRTLPPIAIPQPLPTLPSESRSGSNHRRSLTTTVGAGKSSIARRGSRSGGGPQSSTTVRAPMFPSLTTPNAATTAVTTHTVSNSPERGEAGGSGSGRLAFPTFKRSESDRSSPGGINNVTFSRPERVSVTALRGIDRDRERKRTISNADGDEIPVGIAEGSSRRRVSGVVASSSRVAKKSLDDVQAAAIVSRTVHPADSAAAAMLADSGVGGSRARRKTVTDIVWS